MLPWLRAEMDLVYYGTALRSRYGADVRERFIAKAASAAAGTEVPDVSAIAARFGVGDLPPLDLDALARPFETTEFASPSSYDDTLRDVLERDLGHAVRGNVDSPLKAALDVMRDCRWVLRTLVDFSGLAGASHREDFLGWYVPRASFLAAGPPEVRIRQVLALIDCGLLRLVGPRTEFGPTPPRASSSCPPPGGRLADRGRHPDRRPHPEPRRAHRPQPAHRRAARARGVDQLRQRHGSNGLRHGRRGSRPQPVPPARPRRSSRPGPVRPGHPDRAHPLVHAGGRQCGPACGATSCTTPTTSPRTRSAPRPGTGRGRVQPAATGSAGGQT